MDPTLLASLAGSLLRAGLPALSTVVGAAVPPPWNLLSGLAFAGIKLALGLPSEAAPAEVVARVDADPPAAKAALQPVEDAHADAAAEIQAYLADVQDARHTNVQLVSTGSASAWILPALAIVTAASLYGMGGVLVWSGDAQTRFAVFTALLGLHAGVMNFYFGTSKSGIERSDRVTAMLQQQIAPVRTLSPTSPRRGR